MYAMAVAADDNDYEKQLEMWPEIIAAFPSKGLRW